MIKIAVYGKGGIGKSTVTGNLAAAFASLGKRVIQIGCDPKADSTINLLGGEPVMPVMNYLREHDDEPESIEEISKEGYGGVLCIETGGPTPGLGCAGRGIIAALEELEKKGAYEKYQPDVVIYDVLGDVVCGGFSRAMPIRCLSSHQARVCLYMPPQTSQWRWKISKAVDMLHLAVLSSINAT